MLLLFNHVSYRSRDIGANPKPDQFEASLTDFFGSTFKLAKFIDNYESLRLKCWSRV